MKKSFNKFLAVFVSFVMAVGMVPFSGLVADAATVVGDSSAVTTTYKQVEPSDLTDGDQVLITYNGNVLVAKTSTTAGKSDTTIASDASEITNPPKGSVWNLVESDGKYFFEVTDVETGDMPASGANRLKVDDQGLRISDESSGFTLASNGRIYRERGFSNPPYYGIAYENDFIGKGYYIFSWDETTISISNATKFTFYKKIDVAELTINYQITDADGNITSSKQVVQSTTPGSTVSPDDYFPNNDIVSIDDYTFEKMTYNSTDYTDNQVTVNGDAEITVTYRKAEKVDFIVNFYVNGNKHSSSYSKSVKLNSTQVVDLSKFDSCTFNEMTVNGEVLTEKNNSFKITEKLEVNYYYTDPDGPDYVEPDGDLNGKPQPEYPNQGAVKTSKTATDKDFQSTGLTRVELGVTGVPLKQGTDVVLVIDVSRSMDDDVNGQGTDDTSKKRIQIAKDSALQFVNQIFANNEDGSKSNNRISVVVFSSSGYTNGVLCSLKNVDNKQTVIDAINSISNNPSGGTDYDNAMTMAASVLETVKGTTRNRAVLFMSDGAPENGYNGATGYDIYPNYFKEHEESAYIKSTYNATIYTVSFGLKGSRYDELTETRCQQILRDYMASDSTCYKNANSKEDLQNAFTNIATAIRKAGTNAVVTDTIGDDFSLQMGNAYPSGVEATFPSDYDTSIKILSYSQVDSDGNGIGTPEVIETVTFSDDGTSVTSDKLDSTNIISGNKIVAKNFVYDMNTKTFTWTIGDITSAKIVLSFVEYLNGSMSGGATEKPDYHTNKEALLTYTNYQGIDNSKLPFDDPTLPWGKASVNIVYYLVDKDGNPINSAGEKVEFAWRVEVSKEGPIGINLNTPTTTINASEYNNSGYTLCDQNADYTINNVGSLTGNASIDINGKGTKVVGDYPYTTSTVYFGVLAKTDLEEDTVVLDYGKPVSIDVRDNDGFKSATLDSVSAIYNNPDAALNTGTDNELPEGFDKSATNKYGTLSIKDQDKVTYTPDKYMEGVDKYYYAVKGQTSEGEQTVDTYKYSSVSIIPATSVYYEDNFGGAGTDNQTGGITYTKDENITITTEGTSQTEEQSSNNSDNYGKDSSYSDDAADSNGSSTKIVGNGSQAATFTFKGTGFDLIGRTNSTTGKILVNVYAGSEVGSPEDAISTHVIDTLYQTGTGLYQIPVYNWICSEYKDASGDAYTNGQYTVQIKVAKDQTFYLDAVRIYNPIDVSKNTEDAQIAKAEYDKANESNAQIDEIRELLLSQSALDPTKDCAVFVDKNGEVGFEAFKNVGPNNEVYLAPGQSIGFNISTTSAPKTIQLGVKAPNGASSFVVYTDGDVSVGTESLSTATDMYYKLDTTKIKFTNGKAYIMINNPASNDNIISLTNIKLTFDDAQSSATYEADEPVIAKTKARTLALVRAAEPVEILSAGFTESSVKVNKESTLEVVTSDNAEDVSVLDSEDNEITPSSKSSELNEDGNKVFTINIKHTTAGTNSYKVVAIGSDGNTSESVDVSINVKKQTLLDIIASWFR